MKARLIQNEDVLQLLLCNGKIKTLTYKDAAEFVATFDNPKHYAGKGKWDYEGLTMESYCGATIAFVNDDGVLCVESGELFRKILDNRTINYLTVTEYAEKHDKQVAIVRRCCQNGRIPGVFLKGKTWLIPENAPYPEDERYRK